MQTATIAENKKIFKDVREVDITRAIAKEFNDVLMDSAESDVLIIGASPAGLTASCELSKKGLKVLVIEQNNYLGGGYWLGGYMMKIFYTLQLLLYKYLTGWEIVKILHATV